MRIAYLVFQDLVGETGVAKKIAQQAHAWIAKGRAVRLFGLAATRELWQGFRDLETEIVISPRSRYNFIKTWPLVRRILDWRPDLVYLRYHPFYYPGLGRLMARVPTVLELNTKVDAEMKVWQKGFPLLYYSLTRHRAFRQAAGLVSVCQELEQEYARYGKPSVVIPNGIALREFPELPAARNPEPVLVFIGASGFPWHGVDKILWLARRFTNWRFELVGYTAQSVGSDVPPNVTAHGYLPRALYQDIMRRADVALGTMALERNSMTEACPLKVRECLAYGLPTVIGFRDTDFPQPVPFLLELPCVPDNVAQNTDRIASFVEAWRGRRVPRGSLAHLDVEVKEARRLDFFSKIAAKELPSKTSGPPAAPHE